MRNRVTPVVKYLLIINIGMYILTWLLQRTGIDLYRIFGLFNVKSEYFHPYQFITHMFMHGGLLHIFFNMYALYLFGIILERVWGSQRFLLFFIITGLGAAALQSLVNWWMVHNLADQIQQFMVNPTLENFKILALKYPNLLNGNVKAIMQNWNSVDINQIRSQLNVILQSQMNIPTVGASGAIFGLLMAFGFIFPDVPLMFIFIPIPIKAKWFVIGYGILELFSGLLNITGDNIAHFAHLGGMLFGYIILKIWYKKNWRHPQNY